MSKKNLLNESQVRQFMKLASLTPLTPGFVRGLTETHGRGIDEQGYGVDNTSPGRRVKVAEGEEELESELDATEDELGDEDRFADEEADELDVAAVSDEPVDVDNASDTLSVADVVSAITAALEELTGQPVEASIDGADVDGAEDEVEADVELDAAEDEFAPEGDEVVADMEVEDEEVLEETGAEDTGASKDDDSKTDPGEKDDTWRKDESKEATDELVEQITKRVAARILKAALTKK